MSTLDTSFNRRGDEQDLQKNRHWSDVIKETRKFSSYLNDKHNATPKYRSIGWPDVMATTIFNSCFRKKSVTITKISVLI
jgi:hypothetical protein